MPAPWRRRDDGVPPDPRTPPTVPMIGARSAALVRALRDTAEAEVTRHAAAHPGTAAWARAVRDAAAWAAGEVPVAPITGVAATGQPDRAALRAEDDAAHDAIYRPGASTVPRDYAVAVQHTLMWITGETQQAPLLIDTPDDARIWDDRWLDGQ